MGKRAQEQTGRHMLVKLGKIQDGFLEGRNGYNVKQPDPPTNWWTVGELTFVDKKLHMNRPIVRQQMRSLRNDSGKLNGPWMWEIYTIIVCEFWAINYMLRKTDLAIHISTLCQISKVNVMIMHCRVFRWRFALATSCCKQC